MNRTARWMLAAIVMGACGGGGGGGFNSGVDDDKPFNTLTAAEARTACESLASYFRTQIPLTRQFEITCTIDALGSTTSPDACRAAVSTCLAADPEALFADIDCSMAMADTTCAAAVGDVEQCITADVDVNLARLDRVDCAIAGNIPALTDLQSPVAVPAACSGLTMCAEFQDGIVGR